MHETSTVTVRRATPADADAIADIYNDGIRGRGATFETRERTRDDILAWFADPRFPILVADDDGRGRGLGGGVQPTARVTAMRASRSTRSTSPRAITGAASATC